MTCAGCGRTNRDDSRFCVGCGSSLAPRCPACGREAEADARFCGGCGTALAVPSPAPAPETAGARKVVTIVFADLVGSTALHERLDPESVRRFMEGYYRAMRGAVDGHGGTVTQLLGDGVKAVFGAPRVAEDDALRAVRAAVAMQTAFRALAEQHGALVGKTGLRVAVNTGEVVADEATEIIGDPVNVAARLQEQGRDGDVVIGGTTQRLVAALVTLEPLGSFTLKGRSEAVAAYRVVSLERPAGAGATAFVGRDDELRRLMTVYEAAAAARAARLAVILGSPGLGKSRLIGEMAGRLGGAATLVHAHCDATGSATFAPLAEALRGLLRLEAGASGERVRGAIEDRMPAEGPDRARIAAGVTALLAATPASPEETFFVVRRFLAALAAAQPVVLVIDDLQWAEPLLLDLVEHLVEWSTDTPLLVLVAARPELRDARSSLTVPGGRVAEVVTLAGLDAGAATRLAANAIGADELPAAVAGRVLAISEGNPLFVGELVRMLVQEGALTREGDRWTTSVELSALAMPPTIHALLAARIERLRPEERAVLERAAVVGRQFSRAAVAHLLPGEVTDLDARLEALRRSELLEPASGWFLGEPALTFHHGLIRDAAYRRILKGTRAELHERFADWLASRVGTGVEHDEIMGWHLEQAHQHLRELGPIDARGRALGERAARHLAAAGRRALERDDLPLAGSLLGRAVERLDAADPARADLALDWCEALLAAGDVGPAAPAVTELARFTAGSERLGAWHTCFAGQLAALTDPATLRSTADAVAGAAATLASLDDAAGEAKAHAVHAIALARLGEVGACEAALDRALAAARRAGDRRRANAVLAGAPVAALWGPSPVTRASGRCLDVVRVLRITQGAPAVEAVALRCQAVLEALRGRAEAARRMIAASRKLVEELGITQRLLEAEVATGLIELLEGDAAAAERVLHPAYDGLRRQGLGIDAAQAAALLGRALLAQGRAAEAEALSHESELLAGDDLKAAIAWRGVRAEALARRGEHGEAIALARAAVAIAAATDALLDHADARLALAAALRAAGKSAEADAEEAHAIGLWEAKGAVVLAERARRDDTSVDAATRAPEDRKESVRPVRRRVRTNAAADSLAAFTGPLTAQLVAGYDALVAEDYVGVHHATGLTYGRDEARDRLRAVFRSKDVVFTQEPLATLGDALVMSRLLTSSGGATGTKFDVGPYELESVVVVEIDAQGCRRRFEQFADDRLDDAIARLYERHAELLPDGPARVRAAAIARSVAVHMAPFDIERLASTFAADVEVVDHRTVGFGTLRGADTLRLALRSFLDLIDGFAWRAADVLALEADAFLLRYVGSGTERVGGVPWERTQLELMLFGPDGMLHRWERFEAEHAEAALARFDELVADDRAAPPIRPDAIAALWADDLVGSTAARWTIDLPATPLENAASRAFRRIGDQWTARDWAGLLEYLAPEFRYLDRRRMVLLELDGEGYLQFIRELGGFDSVRTEAEVIATRGNRLGVSWMRVEVAGGAVGPSDLEFLSVLETDARGAPIALVRFDLADREAVYAELDARFDAGEAAAHPLAAAWLRTFRRLVGARDWDGLVACSAPAFVAHDHRLVGWGRLDDAAAWVETLRVLADLAPDVRVRMDHVRMSDRGWIVVGGWVGTRDGGPFEIATVAVSEVDELGRTRQIDLYEHTQLDQALARFAAIDGTPAVPPEPRFANGATRAWDRSIACWRAREWSRYRQLLTAGFRCVDRRRMALLELDGDQFVAFTREIADMPSVRVDSAALATRGDRLALIRVRTEVAGDAVGPSEADSCHVAEIDERGLITTFVRFDLDDLDSAYAELDARWAATAATERPDLLRIPPNAVTRASDRYHACCRARDWDALRAQYSPACVFESRRRMLRTSGGLEMAIANARHLWELPGTDAERTVLATAGDRLALEHWRFTGREDDVLVWERDSLIVQEADAEGRVLAIIIFDLEDRAAASDELAERSFGTTFPPAVADRLVEMNRARRARDIPRLRASFPDEFYFDDHRRTGFGRLEGPDAYMAAVAALYEQSPDVTVGEPLYTLARESHGTLAVGHTFGTLNDGGAFESVFLQLALYGANGLRGAELFELEDLDRARARFAELRPDPLRLPRTAATHTIARTLKAMGAADPDAVRALVRDDFVFEDRSKRALVRGDIETWLGSMQFTMGLPEIRFEMELIATLGERIALQRMVGRGGPAGGEFELLHRIRLFVADAAGMLETVILFDLDDRKLAFVEALERFAAGEAAETGRVTPFVAFLRAFAAYDWEAVRRTLAPDFVFDDRRTLGLGRLDRDQWIASLEAQAGLGPDVAAEVRRVLAWNRHGLVVELRTYGSVDGGGPFENVFLCVFMTAGDRIRSSTPFDPTDADRVLACFAELSEQVLAAEAPGAG